MFNARKDHKDSRRRGGFLWFLAAAGLHGGALALLAFGTVKVVEHVSDKPIDIGIWHAPKGQEGNNGAKTEQPRKETKVARAEKPKKADFKQPVAIPDVAPEASATPPQATEVAGFAGPACPECSGKDGEEGNDPNGHNTDHPVVEKPGRPDGDGQPYDLGQINLHPVPLSQAQPSYPAIARASGLTGTVVLEIVVGPDGLVQSQALISGNPVFATSALETVRSWRYQPVVFHGHAIAWKSQVTLHFQLH